MSKTDVISIDGAQETRSPFDVTGPSVVSSHLHRYNIAALRVLDANRVSIAPNTRSEVIVKSDPNVRFLDQNRRDFGTRQSKRKTL